MFYMPDMRNSFPPKSVHLKRPFAIQPWAGSEENIGNLLMVSVLVFVLPSLLSYKALRVIGTGNNASSIVSK